MDNNRDLKGKSMSEDLEQGKGKAILSLFYLSVNFKALLQSTKKRRGKQSCIPLPEMYF